MIFLILAVVLIVVLAIGLFHYDQQRWRKYKIYREMFFQKNPLFLSCNEKFAVTIAVPKFSYDRLMNNLMLLESDQPIVTQAYLERGGENQSQVKVLINHVMLGYLEKNYAAHFCEILKKSDFTIGRPICVAARLNVNMPHNASSKYCINLDLPEDPEQVENVLSEKPIESSLKAESSEY